MKILLILLVFVDTCAAVGHVQSIAVHGRLMCNMFIAPPTLVKLYDDDFPDFDDILDSVKTNYTGEFYLSGSTVEYLTMDPKLIIYHDCNHFNDACSQELTILIPSSYVTHNISPVKVFEVGTIQLAGKYLEQTVDCIH
ncbi:unnamed protein product [Caenorhabditis bovis]|uniref:Uncharacterized protein n=1 Tax=Caenorhabditis bovis TaxID=2654633 RepID=A0A8S1EMZ2_9PELO|nr:unnamed protein product [Caenorhabditis bovis]